MKKLLAVLLVLILSVSPLSFALSDLSNSGSTFYAKISEPNVKGFQSVGYASDSSELIAVIAIPLRNTGLMASMLQRISDPASPYYHHFLSKEEISNLFLPKEQFRNVMKYINGTGLKVLLTASDSIIVVQGTPSQLYSTLGLKEKLYSNGSSLYYYGIGKSKIPGVYLYSSNLTSLLIKPKILLQKSLGNLASGSGNVTFSIAAYSMKLLRYAYNTTSLLSKGINGKGYNVGILDFYGSPTVTQDLEQFDKIFGIRPPPSFKIVPIGPYDPNLGATTGWDGEIALDVESANAMAPGANITLFAANGALPLVAPIAFIDQTNVDVVSQSFGIFEWLFNQFDALTFVFNALLADQYYMLGSLEGITFLASSGDAGGSGYSAGPEGDVIYPSSSPYVTAVGGTTTYISNGTSGYLIRQTAWSNLPFVPFAVNFGGGGGGVSIVEPRPWYQSSINVPRSYPNGRMTPDLALQSSVYPGSYIVLAGNVEISGGTSEASPLLAGLLTLVMQNQKTKLGLINPYLYSVGQNPALTNKAFNKVTFGYTIPWVPSPSFNLVTGFGAPNIGEIANIQTYKVLPALRIDVFVLNSTFKPQFEFTSGQKLFVVANITMGGSTVSSGSFNATITTLFGTTAVIPMSYVSSAKLWVAQYTVGSETGITYASVSGTSQGVSGSGFTEFYAGYFGTFYLPFGFFPWSTIPGLRVFVNATDLNDVPVPLQSIPINIYTYSILNNTYSLLKSSVLVPFHGLYVGIIRGSLPEGPVSLVLGNGVYGFDPIMSGIDLQTTRIYPQVVAEPGVVYPGQSLFIVAQPMAPLNLGSLTSFETGNTLATDIAQASNVTVSLVDSHGTVLSQTRLITTSCKEAVAICRNGASLLNGYLTVPQGITSGLYTILMRASFNSSTLGTTIFGSYYGQVYVSSGQLQESVSVTPSTTFQNQNVKIVAKITYPNGQPVTNGIFNAFIYPRNLESVYAFVNHDYYVAGSLITLSYNPASGTWEGNVTLPSQYDSSSIKAISSRTSQISGPFDVFVTGESYDGFVPNVSSAMQKRFFIQPFLYVSGQKITSLEQNSQVAFANDEFNITGINLYSDFFLGTNTFDGGTVTISSSVINGTLKFNNVRATLIGVTGGSIVATNSKINLISSSISSLQLTNSLLSSSSSSYQSISPSPAVVTFTSPAAGSNLTGAVTVNLSLQGSSVQNVTLFLDGKEISTFAPQNTITYQLDTTTLLDGTHTLSAVAIQSDGISSQASVTFYTSNQHVLMLKQLSSLKTQLGQQLSSLTNLVSSLQSQLNKTNANLQSSISSLASQLNKTDSNLRGMINTNTYAVGGVAGVALIVAIASLVRRRTGV